MCGGCSLLWTKVQLAIGVFMCSLLGMDFRQQSNSG